MRAIIRHCLDALLPHRCALCEAQVQAHGTLCPPCFTTLRFITRPMCEVCGAPFEVGVTEAMLCGGCASKPPPYAKARAVLLYDDASKRLVTDFKYRDQLHYLAVLKPLLSRLAPEIRGMDMLIPVPLHYWRLLARRFNQATLLAQVLAEQSHVPIAHRLLVRKRGAVRQSTLSRRARFRNVRGIFQVPEEAKTALAGKRVVLVDDVLTTGATLRACTQALLKGGAAEVVAVTLARTPLE